MIIFVCGLSEAGKSTLIANSSAATFGFECVRASNLLAAAGRPTRGLRKEDVLDNQQLVISALSNIVTARPGPLLVDGHLLVETLDGPQLVPEQYFEAIPIRLVVAVEADPSEIAARRRGSEIPLEIEEAKDRMLLEHVQARRLARFKGAKFRAIPSGNLEEFRELLQETNGQAPTRGH
jgi:adenylate kinase